MKRFEDEAINLTFGLNKKPDSTFDLDIFNDQKIFDLIRRANAENQLCDLIRNYTTYLLSLNIFGIDLLLEMYSSILERIERKTKNKENLRKSDFDELISILFVAEAVKNGRSDINSLFTELLAL
jgi:hypothetical protein